MEAIKNYSNLDQSKKLAEILPLESADMHYHYDYDFDVLESIPTITEEDDHFVRFPKDVRCWSLAALLGVLPKIINNETLFIETSAALWHIGYRKLFTARVDNPVDACYELILGLYELKML
jgi:hypothetical protein